MGGLMVKNEWKSPKTYRFGAFLVAYTEGSLFFRIRIGGILKDKKGF
jgi:hypothetical protein